MVWVCVGCSSVECRLRVSSMAGPTFDPPELGFGLGRHLRNSEIPAKGRMVRLNPMVVASAVYFARLRSPSSD